MDADTSNGAVILPPGESSEPASGPGGSGRVEDETRHESALVLGFRVFRQNRMGLVGLSILIVVTVFCFVGPLVYRTDQVHTSLASANLPPSRAHLLGTDSVGYDQLGRLMAGGQMSLKVGVAAALLATALGACWGATAGYFGGLADAAMMRFVDAAMAIPALFLLLVLAAMFRPTPTVVILVIAGVAWLGPARLIRGETLSLRTREYVQASRGMGARSHWIIARHIIPNGIGTIVVNATFQVADAILILAALSFLGLGIAPPNTDWGSMLANGAQYNFNGYWWLIWPPGIAIVLTVVAFNFVGDALRDSFEVRLQRR